MTGQGSKSGETGVDVSIVLTLHREAKYLRRTVAALSEAATFARLQGISVELVAVLDRADFATCAALRASDLSAFDSARTITVDNGSPGPSRNDGCQVASGKYVTLSDGDDLMGYSLIARTYAVAETLGQRSILVPKFIFGFGACYFTVEYFGQDEVSPLATVKHPLYSTRIFAHRSLFAANSFADVPVSSGYAYEDWHFNCNAVALGWRFVVVEDTAWFYRQRTSSQMQESDRISTRQIPPSCLFEPANFVRMFAGEMDSPRLPLQRPLPTVQGVKVLEDAAYRDLIRRANAIDPSVELGRYHWNCLGHFTNLADTSVGIAYYHACEIVGVHQFDAVFLFPASGQSDALISELRRFADRHPKAQILIVTEVPIFTEADAPLIPSGAITIDLMVLSQSLAPHDRDLIVLKLLQSCAASASLHCCASAPAWRFVSRYAALLGDWHLTCYCPADHYEESSGFAFSDPRRFEFISDHLYVIDRIIFSDRQTMESDWLRLPELRDKSELDPLLAG